MKDFISTFTAAEIIHLAFNEFIKTGTRETTKKLTGKALILVNKLRQKIILYFESQADQKAKQAISAIEEQGSLKSLNDLITYLDTRINKEPAFAQELQKIAQQIISIKQQNNLNRQYNYYGE